MSRVGDLWTWFNEWGRLTDTETDRLTSLVLASISITGWLFDGWKEAAWIAQLFIPLHKNTRLAGVWALWPHVYISLVSAGLTGCLEFHHSPWTWCFQKQWVRVHETFPWYSCLCSSQGVCSGTNQRKLATEVCPTVNRGNSLRVNVHNYIMVTH